MFHITNDKRAVESAHKICSALERLLENYPFERINVSQICAEAGVSRPTFYRLFDIPADIIHWYCDTQSKSLACALQTAGPEVLTAPFKFNIRYIIQHPESMELAYRAGRIDIAHAAFNRNISPLLKGLQHKYNISESDLELSTVVVSAIISSALCSWIESSKEESADQFYERIVRIVQHIQ